MSFHLIVKRETDRIKGIKLILKIYTKIINNPTQTQKYGDISLKKISQKLADCQPLFKLLLISGFELSEKKTRLIWRNTNDNMTMLKHIKNTLSAMIDITQTSQANTTNATNNNTHIIHINDAKQASAPLPSQVLSFS